jgi:hypothetical protein
LSLPSLILGPINFQIGTARVVIRPAGDVQAVEQGTSRVSPKINVPVYVLPSAERLIIVKNKRAVRPKNVDGVLYRDAEGRLAWSSHRLVDDLKKEVAQAGWPTVLGRIAKKWDGALVFEEERRGADGTVVAGDEGLRPPQLGALYSIGAHWSIQRSPVTVVMPSRPCAS